MDDNDIKNPQLFVGQKVELVRGERTGSTGTISGYAWSSKHNNWRYRFTFEDGTPLDGLPRRAYHFNSITEESNAAASNEEEANDNEEEELDESQPPPSLANTKQSCYLNLALQFLLVMFGALFVSGNIEILKANMKGWNESDADQNISLGIALIECMASMLNRSVTKNSLLNLKEKLYFFLQRGEAQHDQQGVHSALSTKDAIQKFLELLIHIHPPAKDLLTTRTVESYVCKDCGSPKVKATPSVTLGYHNATVQSGRSIKDSILHDMSFGEVKSRCKCTHKKCKCGSWTDPEDWSGCTCRENLGVMKAHSIRNVFQQLPKILFVTLAVGDEGNVQHADIVIEETMVLNEETEDREYELLGVGCLHEGLSAQYNHFTGIIKSNDEWFHCDDGKIQKLNLGGTNITNYLSTNKLSSRSTNKYNQEAIMLAYKLKGFDMEEVGASVELTPSAMAAATTAFDQVEAEHRLVEKLMTVSAEEPQVEEEEPIPRRRIDPSEYLGSVHFGGPSVNEFVDLLKKRQRDRSVSIGDDDGNNKQTKTEAATVTPAVTPAGPRGPHSPIDPSSWDIKQCIKMGQVVVTPEDDNQPKDSTDPEEPSTSHARRLRLDSDEITTTSSNTPSLKRRTKRFTVPHRDPLIKTRTEANVRRGSRENLARQHPQIMESLNYDHLPDDDEGSTYSYDSESDSELEADYHWDEEDLLDLVRGEDFWNKQVAVRSGTRKTFKHLSENGSKEEFVAFLDQCQQSLRSEFLSNSERNKSNDDNWVKQQLARNPDVVGVWATDGRFNLVQNKYELAMEARSTTYTIHNLKKIQMITDLKEEINQVPPFEVQLLLYFTSHGILVETDKTASVRHNLWKISSDNLNQIEEAEDIGNQVFRLRKEIQKEQRLHTCLKLNQRTNQQVTNDNREQMGDKLLEKKAAVESLIQQYIHNEAVRGILLQAVDGNLEGSECIAMEAVLNGTFKVQVTGSVKQVWWGSVVTKLFLGSSHVLCKHFTEEPMNELAALAEHHHPRGTRGFYEDFISACYYCDGHVNKHRLYLIVSPCIQDYMIKTIGRVFGCPPSYIYHKTSRILDGKSIVRLGHIKTSDRLQALSEFSRIESHQEVIPNHKSAVKALEDPSLKYVHTGNFHFEGRLELNSLPTNKDKVEKLLSMWEELRDHLMDRYGATNNDDCILIPSHLYFKEVFTKDAHNFYQMSLRPFIRCYNNHHNSDLECYIDNWGDHFTLYRSCKGKPGEPCMCPGPIQFGDGPQKKYSEEVEQIKNKKLSLARLFQFYFQTGAMMGYMLDDQDESITDGLSQRFSYQTRLVCILLSYCEGLGLEYPLPKPKPGTEELVCWNKYIEWMSGQAVDAMLEDMRDNGVETSITSDYKLLVGSKYAKERFAKMTLPKDTPIFFKKRFKKLKGRLRLPGSIRDADLLEEDSEEESEDYNSEEDEEEWEESNRDEDEDDSDFL